MSDSWGVGPIEVIPMEEVLEKSDIDEGTIPNVKDEKEITANNRIDSDQRQESPDKLDLSHSDDSDLMSVDSTNKLNKPETESGSKSNNSPGQIKEDDEVKTVSALIDNGSEKNGDSKKQHPIGISEKDNSQLYDHNNKDQQDHNVAELQDLYEPTQLKTTQHIFKGEGPESVKHIPKPYHEEVSVPQVLQISEFESNAIQSMNTLIGTLMVCIIISWIFFKKPISHIFAPVHSETNSSSTQLTEKAVESKTEVSSVEHFQEKKNK